MRHRYFSRDIQHAIKQEEVGALQLLSLVSQLSHCVIDGKFFTPPPQIQLTNYFASGVHHFTGPNRRPMHAVDELVIHDSQSSSVRATIDTLRQKDASVHFIVAPDGRVTQHGDLTIKLGHAEPHNNRSVGIEVVNPYSASRLQHPWTETIGAVWSTHGYILPTRTQAEVVTGLIDWLTHIKTGMFDIPRAWIGELSGHLAMSLVDGAGKAAPGIYAHTYFCPTKCSCKACEDPKHNPCKCKHADGAWLILYAWLRLEAGFSPLMAYAEAKKLGSEVKKNERRVKGVAGHFPVKLPERSPNMSTISSSEGETDGSKLFRITLDTKDSRRSQSNPGRFRDSGWQREASLAEPIVPNVEPRLMREYEFTSTERAFARKAWKMAVKYVYYSRWFINHMAKQNRETRVRLWNGSSSFPGIHGESVPKVWFGEYDDKRFDNVRDAVNQIWDKFYQSAWRMKRQNCVVFAAAHVIVAPQIRLCDDFFGYDSEDPLSNRHVQEAAATLIHEMGHHIWIKSPLRQLKDNHAAPIPPCRSWQPNGPRIPCYGEDNSKMLASEFPRHAVANPDNYAHFMQIYGRRILG